MVTDWSKLLSLFQQTVLEQTFDHLFSCIEKLFQSGDAGKSAEPSSECKNGDKNVATSRQKKRREPQTDLSSENGGGKYRWMGTITQLLNWHSEYNVTR